LYSSLNTDRSEAERGRSRSAAQGRSSDPKDNYYRIMQCINNSHTW